MVSFLILLLFHALPALVAVKDTSKWDAEIDASLKRNIVGCPYRKQQLPPGHMELTDSTAEFLVQVHYPSRYDVEGMYKLPVTLTKADADLRNSTVRHGFTYSKWGKQKKSRWQVPNDHPGQDRTNCINMTLLASSEQVYSFYEAFKPIKRAFYMMHARNAFIHPSGAVGLSCGYYIGMEGCETRWNYAKRWYKACRLAMAREKWPWARLFEKPPAPPRARLPAVMKGCSDLTDIGSPNRRDFNVSRHSKVFTIPALWDYNYHHFISDSLARLARNLLYLKTHRDIMIHVRAYENYDIRFNRDVKFIARGEQMRNEFFQLLGISSSRIISGPVLADQVFIPRFLRCSYLLSNPLEIQLLGWQLLQGAYAAEGIKPPSKKKDSGASVAVPRKTMIIQQRASSSGDSHRRWTNKTLETVVRAFAKHFPEHRIVIHSSASLEKRSLAKELIAFSQADVLVGLHGAGFTSMMFMPPNSLVVEMVGKIVDVSTPVCGYYGPMAAALGHHHYIHSYSADSQDVREDIAASKAAGFYQIIQGKVKDTPIVRIFDSMKVENQGE